MAVMAAVGLVFALQTESIRRAHDAHLGKPQLISVPLFIKIASNLWIVGLVVLLVVTWRERLREKWQARRFRWLAGAAAALVAVSLTINLLSGPIRRQSSQLPAEPASAIVRVKTPAQLEALGYLPGDCNIVAAVDVAEALRSPEGQDYLDHLRLGLIDLGSGQIEKWTGLKWEAIDHLALGLKFDDRLVPRPTLVVYTRRPYDAAALLQGLGATRIPESGHKDRYRFRRDRWEPVLWCPPEGRTLVYAWTPKDLNIDAATAGVEHFAPPLRDFIKERLRQPAPVWLAGHSDRWGQTILKAWLLALPPEDQALLMQVQTFGIWMQFDREATLSAAAACADAAAAKDFKAYLERWAQPVLKDVKVIADGAWVSGQARGSGPADRQALRPTASGE
jgi:hypothetical protein